MTVVNNFGNRFQPSVHYGRQNVNNRIQMNAYMKAYGPNASIWGRPSYQQTTISYQTPNSQLAGFVTGSLLNFGINNASAIGNAAKSVGNWCVGAFNTIKGWFS